MASARAVPVRARLPVKPPPFAYHAPTTMDEALALVGELGDEAAILAGGQSLIPLLNLRLARPAAVVDIGRIPGLDGIDVDRDGITCGAMARAADLERNPEASAALPCLAEALHVLGHPQIRNRTTVGGNVAHADPASELPAVLVAMDGVVSLRSASRGARQVAAADFFRSVYVTARAPDEIVTEVRFPRFPGRSTFLELARRPGDFALVGACVGVATEDTTARDVRIAVCGAGERAVRLATAEAVLVGRPVSEAAVVEAAGVARTSVVPLEDLGGSAEYRAAMVEVLVARGLRRAAGVSR